MTRSSHIKFFRTPNSRDILQRTSLKIRITAPMDELKAKLALHKFMARGRSNPKFIWMHYTHKQILHLYNSVLRGYLNYFSFAHNYSRVGWYLYYILHSSCAKLLAAKFTLRSQSQVIKKFGKDLAYKEYKTKKSKSNDKLRSKPRLLAITSFYKPESFKADPWNFKTSEKKILNLFPLSWAEPRPPWKN